MHMKIAEKRAAIRIAIRAGSARRNNLALCSPTGGLPILESGL